MGNWIMLTNREKYSLDGDYFSKLAFDLASLSFVKATVLGSNNCDELILFRTEQPDSL